ncbi:unnamed protein product [Paramecium sonneborni]|uniref:Uncharacterized protein n=1 Tax=Paramecium sonneborni TaxID=65129 RepID=A0A8S1RAG1_9CILI|nr:unnamed protein product [Paramecium sonneborni]
MIENSIITEGKEIIHNNENRNLDGDIFEKVYQQEDIKEQLSIDEIQMQMYKRKKRKNKKKIREEKEYKGQLKNERKMNKKYMNKENKNKQHQEIQKQAFQRKQTSMNLKITRLKLNQQQYSSQLQNSFGKIIILNNFLSLKNYLEFYKYR